MTKRNERTSPRVAKIAAKVLAMDFVWGVDNARRAPRDRVKICLDYNGAGIGPFNIKLSDIRALAASCLTQAPDKPKSKR